MITQWNDDEDQSLQGLPHLAQLLYLRCLRRYVDYETGLVGVKRKISYQMFREVLYVEPIPGRNLKDRDTTMQVLRTATAQLERAGLIEPRSADRQLVFFLPMALRDESAQKRNNRGATEEQQTSSNRPNPNDTSAFQAGNDRGATEAQQRRNNSPPKSVISSSLRSEEINVVFAYWQQTAGHARSRLDGKRSGLIRDRLKEGYSVDDLKQAIDGNKASPYHQGQNDSGTVYDGLDLILRNAANVDRFIGYANGRQAKPLATSHGTPGASQQTRGNYDQPKTKQQRRAAYDDLMLDGLAGFRPAPSAGDVGEDGSDLWGQVDAIDGEYCRVGGGNG